MIKKALTLLGRKGPRMGTTYRETQRWYTPHKVDRRSGDGRGKPLDEGSAGPIVVENFGGGLCPAVEISVEMMMITLSVA
jgi:hypothetical protein